MNDMIDSAKFTDAEKTILQMMFKLTAIVVECGGGYYELSDGYTFSCNELYELAKKLDVDNYY